MYVQRLNHMAMPCKRLEITAVGPKNVSLNERNNIYSVVAKEVIKYH